MNDLGCVGLCYLFLNGMVILNTWKFFKWNDPNWMPSTFIERQTQSKKSFVVAWSIITLFIFFCDCYILFAFASYELEHSWAYWAILTPFIVLLLGLTYTKTQFLHAMWISWYKGLLDQHHGPD